MAKGSWTQSSFLGGEFSPAAGGRIDLPLYKSALAQCSNAYPIEEGAVTRRPGTMFIQPTYGGFPGAIYPYNYSQDQSLIIELTADGSGQCWVRSFANGHLVTDNNAVTVTAISTANPCEITVSPAANWVNGDQIMLRVYYAGMPASQKTMWSPLVNRQFNVVYADTTHFYLYDALTNAAIDGSGFTGSIPTIIADRVTKQEIPGYTGGPANVQYIDPVLAETDLVLLSDNASLGAPPIVLTGTAEFGNILFTVATLNFYDGPYMDYLTGVLPVTLSGTYTIGGTVTLSVTATTGIHDGAGFSAIDVGRTIRVVQTVEAWDSGTTYSTGNVVSDPAGDFGMTQAYTALPSSAANVGFEPSLNPTYWAPLPNGVLYGWLNVTSIISTTSVNGEVIGPFPGSSTTNPVLAIAMGVFPEGASGTIWPISAAFFEGRMIFSSGQSVYGSIVGGFEGSTVIMSPTDGFGNVLDSSGFAFTFVGPGVNTIFWMHPDASSVLIGTGGSEWQIQASQLGDPLTPTSFQAHQVTKLGSAFHQPVRPGIALLFVNRYSQRLIEYLADPFTSKYSGKPINVYSGHLGPLGQIEYQDAPNPMIWSVGTAPVFLLSCLYRRLSYFASEMPAMYGWAKHTLGSDRQVLYIANGYDASGSLDQLHMMTYDGAYHYVEYLLPPFSDTATLNQAQFVDGGMTGINYAPNPARYEGIYGVTDGIGNMYFNGLYYMAGKTVSVWLAGLDFGDHLVSATGTIGPVAFSSDVGGVGTETFVKAQSIGATGAGAIPISFNEGGSDSVAIPGIIGFSYTTTIQRLRPDDEGAARTQTGPGAGQLRRHHWYSLACTAGVTGTVSVSGGDGFDASYPAVFYTNGSAVATNVLFSGVHSDTIDSNDDLNGQPTLTITRPVPFTLASWSGFVETEEL